MSNLSFKSVIVITMITLIFSQTTTVSKTFPSPDPSWSEYQIKSCCPQGFYEVLNYCVKCIPPNLFDAIDQKCKPCPADHTYSNVTGRCECDAKCDAPRTINPANNKCECKTVNGTLMTYNASTNECICPSNLPLWNGKYCVACPASTEYDPKQKQCYHCPEGFVRDYQTHSCVPGL